jgi:hypothetical protein
MKLPKLLSSPLALRRLIKAHEAQTAVLSEIRDILYVVYNIPRSPREEAEEDDDAFSYSTDRDTFDREERDRRLAGEVGRK